MSTTFIKYMGNEKSDGKMYATQPNSNAMHGNSIILYDGVCNLCAWSVRFVIKRDPKRRFRFAAIQSDSGKRLLETHKVRQEDIGTFVLIDGDRCLMRSEAAIEVALKLSGWWPALTIFSLVPLPIRNWCYGIIARNRYKWFGRRKTCSIPSGDELSRFLD